MSGLPGTFHWRRYPGYPASRNALRTVNSGLVSLHLLAFILFTVFSFNGEQFWLMCFPPRTCFQKKSVSSSMLTMTDPFIHMF